MNRLWYIQRLTYKVPWRNCFLLSLFKQWNFQSRGEKANLTVSILQHITMCLWFRVFITTFHSSKHFWSEPKPNYQTTTSMSAFMLNSHHSLFKDKSNAMGFTSSLFLLHKQSKFQLPCNSTRHLFVWQSQPLTNQICTSVTGVNKSLLLNHSSQKAICKCCCAASKRIWREALPPSTMLHFIIAKDEHNSRKVHII